MATRRGTAHFISRRAAIKYYKSQECDLAEVNRKLKDGEIFIGPPEVKNGDTLLVDNVEGRFFIIEGPRPTMYGDNQRLFDAALAEGKTYEVANRGTHFFKNPDGTYFGWPVGFITGPQCSDNGNPNPYSMSVNGPDGWCQRSGTYSELPELKVWAVKTQKRILTSE